MDSKYCSFQTNSSRQKLKSVRSKSTQTIFFNQKQLSKNISSKPPKFKQDNKEQNINTIAKTSKLYKQLQKQLMYMLKRQRQQIIKLKQIDASKSQTIQYFEQDLNNLDCSIQIIAERIQCCKQQLQYQKQENYFLLEKKQGIINHTSEAQEHLQQQPTSQLVQKQNQHQSEDLQYFDGYFHNNEKEFQQGDDQYYYDYYY